MCVCMRVHAWVGVGVLYRGLLLDSLENDFRGGGGGQIKISSEQDSNTNYYIAQILLEMA